MIYIYSMSFSLLQLLGIMRGCLNDLPTYQWLTVLPQLVSRICHQNDEIVRLVKRIITSVLKQFPQQALWIMAAVSKSTVSSRREAAAAIMQEARKDFPLVDGKTLFVQFASLIDHLIRLCFHAGQSKSRVINISTEFSSLKRMMPLEIIMPLQQSLTVSLPTYEPKMTSSLTSCIFSSDLPTILGIADEAEILSSLQRPKKVSFLYSFNTLAVKQVKSCKFAACGVISIILFHVKSLIFFCSDSFLVRLYLIQPGIYTNNLFIYRLFFWAATVSNVLFSVNQRMILGKMPV